MLSFATYFNWYGGNNPPPKSYQTSLIPPIPCMSSWVEEKEPTLHLHAQHKPTSAMLYKPPNPSQFQILCTVKSPDPSHPEQNCTLLGRVSSHSIPLFPNSLFPPKDILQLMPFPTNTDSIVPTIIILAILGH